MEKSHPVIDIFILSETEDNYPVYSSRDASGADVKASLKEPLLLEPGQRALVPTGLRLGIPHGYEIQIRPRSGLAFKHGITVLNTPGTIDADYTGELKILLINHGSDTFIVEPGMRIAQIILAPVVQARFIKQASLTETGRSQNGFGHTGMH